MEGMSLTSTGRIHFDRRRSHELAEQYDCCHSEKQPDNFLQAQSFMEESDPAKPQVRSAADPRTVIEKRSFFAGVRRHFGPFSSADRAIPEKRMAIRRPESLP